MQKPTIFAVLALVCVGSFAYHVLARSAEPALSGVVPVVVRAEALPLEQGAPAMTGADTVHFRGGWVLSSEHEAFGGFSGLVLEPEAGQLLAINDRGDWWRAGFDAGSGMPPTGIVMRDYAPGVTPDKKNYDAESLIHFKGGYLVAFEQNHRLEWVTAPGEVPVLSPLGAMIDFTGVSNNGGMEAIVELADRRLLAFAEHGLDGDGTLRAWLVSQQEAVPLKFRPPKNFSPTDAARLPDGSVVLLLRRYSVVDGVAIKLMHLQASEIISGKPFEGTEILSLTPQFTVDNMEGLDLVALNGDTVRLVMVSDDNFNSFQRTLLLMFDYKYH